MHWKLHYQGLASSNTRWERLNEWGPDPDEPPVITHEYSDETPPSLAVLQALCVLEDIDPAEDPTELGFVLHDHIDPTALDTILADGSGNGSKAISFDISNDSTYHVKIRDHGEVAVHPTDYTGRD